MDDSSNKINYYLDFVDQLENVIYFYLIIILFALNSNNIPII